MADKKTETKNDDTNADDVKIETGNDNTNLNAWNESSKKKVILHTNGINKPTWKYKTPHSSPFVSKLICYLSVNKIPYEIDTTIPEHPKTNKTPWITYKGKHVADSQLCIEYLNKEFNVNMNSDLTDAQKAIEISYRIMIEDGLFWTLIYYRVMDKDDDGNDNIVKYVGSLVGENADVKKIAKSVQDHWSNMCYNQGISRYTVDVIYKRGDECINSILTYLDDKKFFFGDKMTEIDCVIYGILGGTISMPFVWRNKDKLLPNKKIAEQYIKRIEMKAFGELKYWN